MSEEQQKFELPKWASGLMTFIAVFFLAAIVLSIFLHLFDKDRFPSPDSLGVEMLAAISFVTILVVHFPWSKISFGEIEIERIVQQQNREHVAELEKFKKEASHHVLESVNEAIVAGGPTGNSEQLLPNNRELVVNLLAEYPTWGFSVQRIRNWGGNQAGFEGLKKIDLADLRMIVTKLVDDGIAKIRVSKSGNVLYQISEFGNE